MHLNSLSDAAGRRFAAELRAATAGAPRPGGPAHVMVEVNRRSVALVATGRQRRAVTADTSVVFYRGDWLSMCPPWDRSEVFLEATLEAFGICWIQEGGIYINAPAGCLLQAAGADTLFLEGEPAERFARQTGFVGWEEMRRCFLRTHGLPCDGFVLDWGYE